MRTVKIAMGLDVFVDGVEVRNVTSFNIDEGWVECLAVSPSGWSNQDSEVGEWLKSRLHGYVEIEESEPMADKTGGNRLNQRRKMGLFT